MKEKPVSVIWIEKLFELSYGVKYKPDYLYKDEVLALYQRMSATDKNTD